MDIDCAFRPILRPEPWSHVRYMQPPSTSMVFTVWFDPDYRVLRTSTALDPDTPENCGGR